MSPSCSIVWMVPILPLISKSSTPRTNPLLTVPSAPIKMGITVTFKFHSFSVFSKANNLTLFSLFFQFYPMLKRNSKFHNFKFFQSFPQTFENHSECTNYNFYHRQKHVPQYFWFSGWVKLFCLSIVFFYFHSEVRWSSKFFLIVT